MGEGDGVVTRRDVAAMERELSSAGLTEAYEVGRGGFGVVYRCLQPSLDRTVAVKVLTGTIDDENLARFFREQRAMGRLTGHPNIVNVLHVGTTASGHPYIVMPYHPLDSLDTWIREKGPLSQEQVLRMGVKIAGAVETAHRLGILHRDIKPGNILLSSYGEPALTDFGIAHIRDAFETSKDTITASPAFTAPEILKGAPPTPASDVYSIGATLFCALTGHAAFERRSGEQMMAQFVRITRQPVPDLREYDIPEDIAAAIEHAMTRNPGDRPRSAVEFGDELRAIQARKGLDVDEMALQVDEPSAPIGRRDENGEHPRRGTHVAVLRFRVEEEPPSGGNQLRRSPGRTRRRETHVRHGTARYVDGYWRGGEDASCAAACRRHAQRVSARRVVGGVR